MKKILLLILILYCRVGADTTHVTSSMLPLTISTGGAADTFLVVENLTWDGSGSDTAAISILIDSITLNFQTYNLTFGSNTNDSIKYGVWCKNDFVTITGTGKIQGGWDYNHQFVWNTRCVNFSAVEGCRIENLEIVTSGNTSEDVTDYVRGTHGIVFSGGANMFNNAAVNITGSCVSTSYYYRQYFPNSIIATTWSSSIDDSKIVDTTTDYHLRVDSCTLTGAIHSGILFYGQESGNKGMFWCRGNNVQMKIRGMDYWAGSGFRYGDAYGITLKGVTGFILDYDTVWAETTQIVDANGDTVFGGQGIFIDRGDPIDIGDSSFFNKITNCFLAPSTGDQGGGHSTGIHGRAVRKLLIENNYITCASDSVGNGNSTPWRSGEAHNVWFTFNGQESIDQDSVLFRNNNFNVQQNTGGTLAVNFRFRGKGAQWYWETRNNILTTNDVVYYYNGDDSCNSIYSFGDSIISTGYTYEWYPYSLYFGLGERTYDLKFASTDSADTSINTGGSGNKELSLYKSVTLTINGSDAQPVQSALCSLFTSIDTIVGSTNASGIFEDTALYYYFTNAGGENRYDPLSIKVMASGGADSVLVSTFNLANISGGRDTTLTLSATLGGGEATTYNKKYRKLKIRRGKL